MAKCTYCGSTILMGGKKEGELRFCNDQCLHKGALMTVADQVPDDIVQQHISAVHSGSCPLCEGQGPVDVHTSHRIWSALLLTSWCSRPQISCRACGIKHKIQDTFFSLFLGWWGFPWGIFITPVQIIRNVSGLFMAPDPTRPSEQLEKLLRMNLASQVIAAQEQPPAGPTQ